MAFFRKKKPTNTKKSTIGKGVAKKAKRRQSPRQAFLKIFMKELSGVDGMALISAFSKGDSVEAHKAGAKLIAMVMAKADVPKK